MVILTNHIYLQQQDHQFHCLSALLRPPLLWRWTFNCNSYHYYIVYLSLFSAFLRLRYVNT